jgi:PAS domain S-box-containing protein
MTNPEPSKAVRGDSPDQQTGSRSSEEPVGRSEQCLRQLFDHAADGIFVHGADGRFTDANRACCEMLGYPREALLQRHAGALFLHHSPETMRSLWAGMQPGRPVTLEDELRRRDGSTFPVEVRLVVFEPAEGGRVFIGICRDITKRRQAEAARAKAEVAILEERNRMAREIHDTLAQGFTGILLQLEAAEAAAEAGLPVEPYLGRVRELARFGLGEARRSVLALRPLALEENGLEQALQQLAGRSSVEGALTCEFSAAGAVRRLQADLELALFRIAQEAVGNAIKHAEATRVWIELAFEPHLVRLSVEDDGVGLAKAPGEGTRAGYGLVLMQERAQQIGGTLAVESRPGAGARVTVTIPLSTSAAARQP